MLLHIKYIYISSAQSHPSITIHVWEQIKKTLRYSRKISSFTFPSQEDLVGWKTKSSKISVFLENDIIDI